MLRREMERLGLPVARALSPLATVLGIETEEPRPAVPTNFDQVRWLTITTLVQLLVAHARGRTLLLTVEDAHWIDTSTEELLGHLLHAIPSHRALVVLTARPEFRPPWTALAHVAVLSLTRLSRRETEAMVKQVAGTVLSDEVVRQLVARTDGVPLFIEELTRTAMEGQADARSGLLAVPATLQEALTARLDRLAPVREFVQAAALLGRVFDVRVVQGVVGFDHAKLDRALEELMAAGLVFRRAHEGVNVFEFKHALIQDTARDTLVRERRTLLHGRIAEVLRQTHPDLARRQPEILADHLEQAGDHAAAWLAWRAAGDLAISRSASREAVAHLTRATACLCKLDAGVVSAADEASVYVALAGALMRTEGYRSSAVADTLESAREAAAASGSLAVQLRVAISSAPFVYANGTNTEFLRRLNAVASSDQLSMTLQAMVQITGAIGYFNRGEYVTAYTMLRAVMEWLPPGTADEPPIRLGEGDPAIVLRSYSVRCATALGRLDEAREIGIETERIGRELNDPFNLAWGIFIRSTAYSYIGEHRLALIDADTTIAICREHGFTARLGNGLMRRGSARAHLGDLEAGIEEFRTGRATWRDSGVVFHAREHAVELADLLLLAGRADEAAAVLDDADAVVAGTDDAHMLADAQRLRGIIAAAQDDTVAALQWLERAIASARAQGARLCELRAVVRRSELLIEGGRRQEAIAGLQEFCDSVEGLGAPDVRVAQELLERLSK
jgi:tetratricopeptide (TPR) repeat protein